MAIIVAFATQKGGSGKSTLTAITAAAIHNRTKKKVLIIDADKQGTLRDLRELEGNPDNGVPVEFFNWQQKGSHEKFIDLVDKSDQEYDLIFIDSPGRIDEKETNLIISASDIVVVPLVASPFDVKSARAFLDEIKPLVDKQDKTVVGIINKRDRTVEHAILSGLDGYNGMELMTAYISNLARYKRDVSTVNEITSPDDPTDEYNQYIKEFLKLIK
ncbi:ParA family protein [Catalinimonas sp. 4WD22]|uniref:ParA family protein n=1 Tax=Catalinimonas locisalis TaxID=3133978 RepID=UPI003100CC07